MSSTPKAREKRFMGAKTSKEHLEISSKGGKAKVRKGLASLSPERLKEIQKMALKARTKKKEENDGKEAVVVEVA